MSNILIVYASTDGQTQKISLRLKEVIGLQGLSATVIPVEEADTVDLTAFDKVVLGASVRYGKHDRQIIDFIDRNRALLESKPTAFFSVNLVARKPEKQNPAENLYLQKFLKRLSWTPRTLAVFAGNLDYPSYRPMDRFMIRLIMWMTKGPTDPTAVIEFTDWERVEDFGRVVCEM